MDDGSDPWPDEPDEFDPHSLGPPIPRVGTEDAGTPGVEEPDLSDVEISGELFRAFWSAVLFANVGLFCVSLGAMLIYFRGQWDLGLGLVAGGVLALAFTYQRYYDYVHRDEGETSDGNTSGDAGRTDGGDDP